MRLLGVGPMPTFLHLNVVISCRRPPSTLMLLIQGYPLEQVKYLMFFFHMISLGVIASNWSAGSKEGPQPTVRVIL